MTGFITIERDQWDNPLFKRGPMTEFEAWMWMQARAAWADTTHFVGAEELPVPRGSFMVTLRELQSAFMWSSDKKVRTFLEKLERNYELSRQSFGTASQKKTQITICKYNDYQDVGQTKDASGTQAGRKRDAVKKPDNQITRETNVSQARARAVEILATIVPQQLAADFAEHRRELKKPLTEKAAAAMVTKLDGHHDPGAVLTDSIANGWQGIFPDKIKPQFKTITGGRNERPDQHSPARRTDPALEQALRLAGVSQAQGDAFDGA